MQEKSLKVIHPIAPVYDSGSRILILGSFPSVRSREQGFFYGHPQNRFWKTLAGVLECEPPRTVQEKRAFLLAHGIALWDVIASCEIQGSSDSSIRNAVANDLTPILQAAPIQRIFTNGKTAHRLFVRYLERELGREATCLPSTSPANAAWSQDRLNEAWREILGGEQNGKILKGKTKGLDNNTDLW